MKLILLCAVFCFWLCIALHAQTRADVKLYAYARAVTGGAMPRVSTKENSLQADVSAQTKFTYLIYLEGPAKNRLYPVEMYIHGERKGVRVSVVEKTPVEIKTGELPQYSKTITLVPYTSKKVYQLDMRAANPEKEMPFAKAKSVSNEVVIVYKCAGKFYYAAQKKFHLLEPVVLQ